MRKKSSSRLFNTNYNGKKKKKKGGDLNIQSDLFYDDKIKLTVTMVSHS